MKISRNFLLIILLILSANLSSFSQNEKSSEKKKSETVKISTIPIEVKANLLVVDAAEEVVDIKAEDIKIFEDGVEQKLTQFIKKEPVLNLGLLFDNSSSIRDKLNEINTAGKILVANLRDNDQSFIVRFVSSDKIEIVQEFTNNKILLTKAIDGLYIEGGQTALLDALYLSAEKLLELENKDKSKRYAIVLFSDADDRDSYYKTDEVMKKFAGTDLQVFFVSYALTLNDKKTQKKAIELGQTITWETGGTLQTLTLKHSKDDLINAIKAIIYELRSQYIISYTSTNQLLDEKPRKLTVQISDSEKGEKRTGVIRESFTVPKK